MSELLSAARGPKHSYSLSNKQIKYVSSQKSPCSIGPQYRLGELTQHANYEHRIHKGSLFSMQLRKVRCCQKGYKYVCVTNMYFCIKIIDLIHNLKIITIEAFYQMILRYYKHFHFSEK